MTTRGKGEMMQGLPEGVIPMCPKCGSTNGVLGTSYAYFVCGDCKDDNGRSLERYWTDDYLPVPHDQGGWPEAIRRSPFGRFHPSYRPYEMAPSE